MSTAPKELRKVDLSAKMSKSKKKKLKKREKRNQALMEEAMQHVMEADNTVKKEENGTENVGLKETDVAEVVVNGDTDVKEVVFSTEEKGSEEEEEKSVVVQNGNHDALLSPDCDAEDSKSVKSETGMSVTSPEEETPPTVDMRTQSESSENRSDVIKDSLAAMMEQQGPKKPDPCSEVVPELTVKIADLGNACWVMKLSHRLIIATIPLGA